MFEKKYTQYDLQNEMWVYPSKNTPKGSWEIDLKITPLTTAIANKIAKIIFRR